MTTTTTMQVFNGSAVAVKNYASGARRDSLMRQKKFVESKGLKGAAGRRAFKAYLRENGVLANQRVAAELAGGKILVTAVTMNAKRDGGTIRFCAASKAEEKLTSAQADKVAVATAAGVAAERAKLAAALSAAGVSADVLALLAA